VKSWYWNGELFEPCDSVALGDRGFRYGMSVFESLRVAGSEPLFLDAHLDRIVKACADRDFRCDERAFAAVEKTLRASRVDGLARVYVTAGEGALNAPATACRVFLFIEPRDLPVEVAYDITNSDEIFHPLFGGLKTGNYWANVNALRCAQLRGKHEALLYNERAELVSACLANVFVVHGSRVRTPSIRCGARDGVMRESVMQSIDVDECSLSRQDVLTADEIFLTNSWIRVMPVASIDDRTLQSNKLAQTVNLR
jgi:branched-subunit amino acid aminotransferase/4-amino-4-deoxychorismate lyase